MRSGPSDDPSEGAPLEIRTLEELKRGKKKKESVKKKRTTFPLPLSLSPSIRPLLHFLHLTIFLFRRRKPEPNLTKTLFRSSSIRKQSSKRKEKRRRMADRNNASSDPASTAQALQALFHALDPVSLLRSQHSRKAAGGGGGAEQRCPAAQISPSTVAEGNDASPHPASTAPALLDPVSLLLSQNSATDDIVPLRLTTDHYYVERGPRYNAYARLRESRLRMKHARQEEPDDRDLKLTPPPKKQVRFQGNLGGGGGRRGSPSILAQSVPDFSSVLKKENRKPAALPSLAETTPPPSKSWSRASGGGSNARGSKSVGAAAGEKKGGLMARKSYASVEELKGLSCAAASAINGDDRGRIGRGNGIGRTILGYRKF